MLVGHSFGSLTSWLETGTYGDVDPAVVAQDEATRREIPAGVGATIPIYVPMTLGIRRVPVLVVNGRYDKPFCAQGDGGSLTNCTDDATLRLRGALLFSSRTAADHGRARCGYNLNLQYNADVFFDCGLRWFQAFFPPTGR